METFNRKQHWENIYQHKQLTEVSWYQQVPETSLNYIHQFQIPHSAQIMDMGGGDSFLADCLLSEGYQNISVADISVSALERAKQRLGNNAGSITWIEADAGNFVSPKIYDFWHDRATFHFLTTDQEVSHYVENLKKCIVPKGIVVMGTFSVNGPQKCSGIEIRQYSEESMKKLFSPDFELISCEYFDHHTPFDTIQNFIFCCFQKNNNAKNAQSI